MNKPTRGNAKGVPVIGDNAEIDWTRIDVGVEYEGKKIKLPGEPGEMPYDVAIDTLRRIRDSEDQEYEVHELIDAMPWDAIVAVHKALIELYGVVLPETVKGWAKDFTPEFVTIKIGPDENDVVQVPQGYMRLPGVKSMFQLSMVAQGAVIHGEVVKKDRARLVEIANRARAIVKTDSIYKGKAIALKVKDNGRIDVSMQPDFFDVRHVTEADMIHNDVTEKLIATSILAPIKHTEACRRHGIPLKRGILLEGRYGTGKTLTARVAASVAQANGWTFVVLDKPQGLAQALEIAVAYQPAVVFAEDIDRFADRTNEPVNHLINLMDGLVPTSAAVMTVLTTNHVDKIDRALLRPGRFDAVISIDPPEAKTVERLLRFYGGANLQPIVNTEPTGFILAGQIPATVAEVVKRAKLAMLMEDRVWLTEEDLVTAAEGMKRHLDLLSGPLNAKSPGDRLADALTEVLPVGAKLDILGTAVLKILAEVS